MEKQADEGERNEGKCGGGAAGEVEIGVWLVRGIVKAVEETDNEGSGKGSLWFSDVFPPERVKIMSMLLLRYKWTVV